MGRFLLLLLAGVTLTASYTALNRGGVRVLQTGRVSQSAEESMARQAALSGFDIAERRALSAPDTEWAEAGVPLDGGDLGSYDAEATVDGKTTFLDVLGRYGRASHAIYASYTRGLGIPATLMAHAGSVDTGGDPEFSINGAVHRPPSVSATGWDGSSHEPVAGIAAATVPLQTEIQAGLGGRISRVSGSPAFTAAAAPEWVQPLVDEALTHPGAIVKSSGRYLLREGRVGSPEAPAVVVAQDGARLEDAARGFGVLIVTGDFTMIDDARWEGIIVVRDTPGERTRVLIEDEARVFGTLILHGNDEAGGPDPVGDYLLRILDTADLLWSAEPIKRLEGQLDALDPVFAPRRVFRGRPSP